VQVPYYTQELDGRGSIQLGALKIFFLRDNVRSAKIVVVFAYFAGQFLFTGGLVLNLLKMNIVLCYVKCSVLTAQ
jgi:hypothetical protein